MATRYPKSTKWTVKELTNIPAEWKGDTLSESDGLSGNVRVSSAGTLSIAFRYGFKWEGKKCWYYCGAFPKTDIAKIREVRDEARKTIALRIDPRLKKTADIYEAKVKVDALIAASVLEKTHQLSFNDLFNTWISDGVNRADGNESLVMSFNKHALPALGNILIKELSENDLRAVYRGVIKQEKYRTAVLLSKAISQMLRWAEKRQPWRSLMIDGNPSELVEIDTLLPQNYSEERERILDFDEIRKLDKTFSKIDEAYGNAEKKYEAERPIKKETQYALWICLGSLCRIGELLMSEWAHINFEARTWYIPKKNVKGTRRNRQDQLIYMSDFVLKQFKQLHSLTGESKWIFPATNKDSHICKKSISKQVGDRQTKFKQLTKALTHRANNDSLVIGEEKWTPHDLRRTGTTMMQGLNITLDVIDRCQNHVLAGSKVRRHYMHFEYADEKQDAWIKLGDRIEAILSASL